MKKLEDVISKWKFNIKWDCNKFGVNWVNKEYKFFEEKSINDKKDLAKNLSLIDLWKIKNNKRELQ